MLPSVQSAEVFCGAVHSALWHDLPPSTRDWEETAVKLQKLGFRSYLLVISWRFLQGVGEFSEGLKYYVDAVESLLQHGLEPVLVLDFNVPQQTCQDFQSPLPAQLAQVMDAFIPHVRCWFTLLEHSRNLPGKSPEVKRRWHSEHSDPFHCARLGDAAAQLALAQQGVALGVLLAIDWLEPGDGGMAKELTERIMRRQMASFCWENSEKSNGTNGSHGTNGAQGGHGNNGSMSSMSSGYGNKAVKSPFRDRSIMILPRYAGHIHVLAPRDVKISDMSSLDFKTLKKMVKWFREEAGLADDAAIHIIASIHTPVSQIFHGIQHIHHMNERLGIEGIPQSFAGFWIDEENAMNAMSIDARPKLPQSFQTSSPFEVMEEIRRLFSSGDRASTASTLSFLVALSALEHLGDLDDQTISRIRAAIKGSVGTDGMHGMHGTDGVPPVATSQTASPASPASRQAKWDRTLSGAVNFRRKKSRDFATLAEMEMEIMDPTGHPTPQTQTQQICDLAAQIFLSWRRKMRGSLESEMMCFCGHPDHPDLGRLHIPSIMASLEAVLLLSQVQLPELRLCQKACLALRAAKESSTRSLPPLQPLPLQPSAKPAQSQSNDVEAADSLGALR